jgi:hypothetical protein
MNVNREENDEQYKNCRNSREYLLCIGGSKAALTVILQGRNKRRFGLLTVQTDKVLQVRIFKKINMFLWTREKKLEFYDIIKKNVKKKDGNL